MIKEFEFEIDCDMTFSHLHDCMEILYVMSGRIGVMQTKTNILVREGEFIVFNPFEHHEHYREPGAHTVSLYISYNLLKQLDMPSVACCSSERKELGEYYELIRGKLAIIYKEYTQDRKNRAVYCLSHLLGILDLLKQKFAVDEDIRRDTLSEVLLYLNHHFSDDINLVKVAKDCHISTGYLSRHFHEVMGIHFSDYLRKLRLSVAASLISTTNKSVTEIALSVGFGNPNTLIYNFKKQYGMTPYKYKISRQLYQEDAQAKNRSMHDIGLLKYAGIEAETEILSKPQRPMMNVSISLKSPGVYRKSVTNVAIGCGYAKLLLGDEFSKTVERISCQIKPEYLQIQGIFDDTMHAYFLGGDGSANFDFYLIDQVLDRIRAVSMKPWIEIGRIPGQLTSKRKNEFYGAYMELPNDLNRWSNLVSSFMDHISERYGVAEISQWRFSITPALYVSYGFYSMEDYLEYYRQTFEVIRAFLPEAIITGGTFDCGLLRLDGTKELSSFLVFCKKNNCIPNLLSLQEFFVDYDKTNRDKILEKIDAMTEEPVPLCADPDLLAKDEDLIKEVLKEEGLEGLPITFLYWNSTIWYKDLGSDTCYNSAFLAKHAMENLGKVESLVASVVYSDEDSNQLFTGTPALFTQNVPKAMYHTYGLLNQMEGYYVDRNNGYAISKSKDGSVFTILLYNYCPPDPAIHLSEIVSREEQLTIDRYYSFQSCGVQNFCIEFFGDTDEIWEIETTRICRESGSSYDYWRRMGAPSILNAKKQKYLEEVSQPGYTVEQRRMLDKKLKISGTIDEHEVRLIRMRKKVTNN
ncbi:GH39 family glycosyl hydrolase [Streptococcus rifensis]